MPVLFNIGLNIWLKTVLCSRGFCLCQQPSCNDCCRSTGKLILCLSNHTSMVLFPYFNFSNAVKLPLLERCSKLVRNFSKRNNFNHCVLLPPPPSQWRFTCQGDRWTTQKPSVPVCDPDASHYRILSLQKRNVVLQLVPWFILQSSRAFPFRFVKEMFDDFWQTIRPNLLVMFPCCIQH